MQRLPESTVFLATRDIVPSDQAAERASLVTSAGLAARGKRRTTVARAADLLRGYGGADLVAALERRLAELDRRQSGGDQAPGR